MARACATPSIATSAKRALIAELNSFVESYGSKLLDASILLLPSVGFLPPSDPRVRGTLAAIEKHLMRDGFVLRHDPREVSERSSRSKARSSPARSGLPMPMCWRARSPRRRRCSTAWSRSPTISACWPRNSIPAPRRQTGNFPQALTHIALINTAHNLSDGEDSQPRSRRCSGRNSDRFSLRHSGRASWREPGIHRAAE